MASRRVRIKGIANIPQRRKGINSNQEEVTTDANTIENSISNLNPAAFNSTDEVVLQNAKPASDSALNLNERFEEQAGTSLSVSGLVATENVAKPHVLRRRFIKPTVSQNAINRVKIKDVNDNNNKPIVGNKNECLSAHGEDKNSLVVVHYKNKLAENEPIVQPEYQSVANDGDQIEIKKDFSDQNENVGEEKAKPSPVNKNNTLRVNTKFVRPSFHMINAKVKTIVEKEVADVMKNGEEISINEIILPACKLTPVKSTKILDITKLPKPQYIDGSKSGSDTDYPPPAASPNKFVNRARIKAVPRLSQRRTSFTIGSASESEDESKRSVNRIRNDSVSSAVSGTHENHTLGDQPGNQKKEFSSVIQRKCRRTEQSRKLAEARREFYMKYNNVKPDRQNLTMLDLIFYNPTSSPMSQKKRRRLDTDTSSIMSLDEDKIGMSSPLKAAKDASDEENTVPAPQITIGANGEIIIDEKSLVIENEETTKNREALKQSQVVDGDFDTGYGVYKRVKRSRDWSKTETLRFYKALNTIGTDFTMMCELFPDRNRKELKMKFKKEERMNRNLIDRAVMQPIQFDMTELRKDVEIAEMEKAEVERCRKEKELYKMESANKRKSSVGSIDSTGEKIRPTRKTSARKRTKRQEILKSGIGSICDSDSDHSVSTIASTCSKSRKSDSDDEENAMLFKPHTTRSGRTTKPKLPMDTRGEIISFPSSIPDDLISVSDSTPENDEKNLTPGTLMIFTNLDNNGKTVYNIYTVDENGKKVPIELTQDIMENLTKETGSKGTYESQETAIDEITVTDNLFGDNSVIIPFDEYEDHLLNATDVPLLNESIDV